MLVIQPIEKLKASADLWSQDYIDYALSAGRIYEGKVIFDYPAQQRMREKYPQWGPPRIFSLEVLKASAPYQPIGFVDQVLACARIVGDDYTVHSADMAVLELRYPRKNMPLVYRMSELKDNTLRLPLTYLEFVIKHGKVDGGFLILSIDDHKRLQEIFGNDRPQKYSVADLKAAAYERPKGYLEYVLARAKVENDSIIVDRETRNDINEKFPRLIAFNVAELKKSARRRPPGLIEYVLANGTIEDGHVILPLSLKNDFYKRFPAQFLPDPPDPTLSDLATNFSGAMVGWAKAGFKTVSRKIYETRNAACLACPHWDPQAIFGKGRCKICGCSKLKLWLASSKCPDTPSRW